MLINIATSLPIYLKSINVLSDTLNLDRETWNNTFVKTTVLTPFACSFECLNLSSTIKYVNYENTGCFTHSTHSPIVLYWIISLDIVNTFSKTYTDQYQNDCNFYFGLFYLLIYLRRQTKSWVFCLSFCLFL